MMMNGIPRTEGDFEMEQGTDTAGLGLELQKHGPKHDTARHSTALMVAWPRFLFLLTHPSIWFSIFRSLFCVSYTRSEYETGEENWILAASEQASWAG